MEKPMKACSKCGISKNFDSFYKHGNGLRPDCKECRTTQISKWQDSNIEKIAARRVVYKSINPEKIISSSAKYRAANQERRRLYNNAWHTNNPFAARIFAHNYNARKTENGGKLSPGISARLHKLQRGKCVCGCKQPLGDKYHLDHRMPLALGGANEDWNMQLLRSTCNQRKHAKHPIDFMRSNGFLL